MKRKKYLLLFLIPLLNVFACLSQPGSIDPTFNPVDSGFWEGMGFYGGVNSVIVQNDGKMIVGGSFQRYNETKVLRIARLNTNGTIDDTFKIGTGTNNTIQKMILQKDGKIIIGGDFSMYNGVARGGIVRLNVNGSVDTTFNPGTGLKNLLGSLSAIEIQQDGKIIIGGRFTSFNGTNINRIARLNADGTLDASFNVGTGVNEKIYCISIQSDGRIIIGGNFISYNGVNTNRIACLNPDGSLNSAFKQGMGADTVINSISLQSDGKLILGGLFNSYNGSVSKGIARLNTDGSIDPTFNVGTGVGNGAVNIVCLRGDGKVIIAGNFSAYNGTTANRIACLNPDGSLDNAFYLLPGADAEIRAIALQVDGKMVMGGYFEYYNDKRRNCITRLQGDGTVDTSIFNLTGLGVNGNVFCSKIQNDGKIVVGGDFTSFNGIKRKRIMRLNSDGSLDTTFNTGSGADDFVESVALQSDGKVILGGYFKTYNGKKRTGLVRLNNNGSMDSTFDSEPESPNFSVESVSVQQDGKIIIGGSFNAYKGIKVSNVARLQPDGKIDTTFKMGSGIGGDLVWSTLILSNGKIILSGGFNSYNGVPRLNIARLNADGTLDDTFKPGSGTDGTILTTSVQNDGKVIIGGAFTLFNGSAAKNIARLNEDGSLDNTFSIGTGASGTIVSSAIQQDGKLFVGGIYTAYNGTPINRFMRLNTDGTLDNTFLPGSSAESTVWTIEIQMDGKIIIGGYFTSYNGTGRNCIARINGDKLTNVNEYASGPDVKVYPNPSTGEFTIEGDQIEKISIMDNLGRLILEKKNHFNRQSINLININNGIYFLRMDTAHGQITKKIIISR
jgi:uncharacterized delta-60 repeat protein